MDRSAMLGYAAAALGLLSFVWGFLDWFSDFGGTSGYSSVAAGVVGLSIAAGLVALGAVVENKPLGIVPAALAVAAALVALGVLISHENLNTSIGLILAFITALVQAAVCVFAYLESQRSSGGGLSLGGGGGRRRGGSSGASGSAQPAGGYGAPSSSGGPGGP